MLPTSAGLKIGVRVGIQSCLVQILIQRLKSYSTLSINHTFYTKNTGSHLFILVANFKRRLAMSSNVRIFNGKQIPIVVKQSLWGKDML